jgi:PAS domain S-box-containing protein
MASINILLVDDDIKNLTVLEAILDAPDYRLIKASNAEETLRVLMEEECAAIVMDVKMPDMSGIELAQLIKQRKRTRDIPILFLTAHYYEERHMVLGYDAGAVDYITKPVHPAVLRSKIAVFVELFRKTAALARLNAAMEAEIMDRQKAEERFRLVVESAPHAMVVVDQNDRIALVNPRTETLFGYHREELLGEALERLIPAGLPVRSAGGNGETPTRGGSQSAREVLGRRKDGTGIPMEVKFGSFQSADGHFELASLVDITQRKEAEAALLATNAELAVKNAELQRAAHERSRRIRAEAARAEAEAANSAKDRFLAMLSHELRTPLSPVLHAVALIEEEQNCPDNLRATLETIRRNVQLEARLIDDLLDLARIRNGKLQLNLESADAHDLLRSAVEICEPDILKRSLDLKLDLNAKQTRLHADPARIQQIFWNLINNAIKYTGPGGTIQLTTIDEPGTRRMRVEVADTGIGIRPERLGNIFDAFEQVHDDRSTGLGLGLAISRVLTEMHGGSIEARSPGANMGSVFTVFLPVTTESPAQKQNIPRGLTSLPGKLRVLLVEDHADTADNLKRLLAKRGCDVQTAASLEQARNLINSSAFDILLSDIGLPDGQGLELMPLFIASAMPRAVAGIALSGYGMPEDIRRSREAGFAHHLTKPIDISQLQETLLEVANSLTAAPPPPAADLPAAGKGVSLPGI